MIMCIYFFDLAHFRGQGRNTSKIWFLFWEIWRDQNFLLRLTDLYFINCFSQLLFAVSQRNQTLTLRFLPFFSQQLQTLFGFTDLKDIQPEDISRCFCHNFLVLNLIASDRVSFLPSIGSEQAAEAIVSVRLLSFHFGWSKLVRFLAKSRHVSSKEIIVDTTPL